MDGFHTFPVERADDLEDASRFRFCSREELLGHLDVDPDDTLLDLGSGTGFYTDELAPFVERVVALDVQQAMGVRYREKGHAGHVHPVTGAVESLPLADGSVNVAVSTMTFHEFASERTLGEVARVLDSGGRFVSVDWSADGRGADGPPVDERYSAAEAVELCEAAGMAVSLWQVRPETFVVVAVAE
jgi:ubiquinone/menaquinone biosynthesis C-methylase UbiE